MVPILGPVKLLWISRRSKLGDDSWHSMTALSLTPTLRLWGTNTALHKDNQRHMNESSTLKEWYERIITNQRHVQRHVHCKTELILGKGMHRVPMCTPSLDPWSTGREAVRIAHWWTWVKHAPENGSASKRNETKFLSIRLRSKNWIMLHLSTWQVKGGPVSGPIPELLWETSGKHGKLLTQLKQSNPAYTHFWFYVFQEFCRLYRLLHFTSEAWRPYPPCRLYYFAIFCVKNAVSVPPEAEIATFEDRPHVRLLAGQIPVQGVGAHPVQRDRNAVCTVRS